MSYENAPVELTHGHYYTCGGFCGGGGEGERRFAGRKP